MIGLSKTMRRISADQMQRMLSVSGNEFGFACLGDPGFGYKKPWWVAGRFIVAAKGVFLWWGSGVWGVCMGVIVCLFVSA